MNKIVHASLVVFISLFIMFVALGVSVTVFSDNASTGVSVWFLTSIVTFFLSHAYWKNKYPKQHLKDQSIEPRNQLTKSDFFDGAVLDIVYQDRKGNITERNIEVEIVEDKYIQAFCWKAEDIRTFNFSNILNLSGQKNPVITTNNPAIQRAIDKEQDEFLGLLKGIIADGVITEQEIKYLNQWIVNNKMQTTFPATPFFKLIKYANKKYTGDFENEFLKLAIDTVGVKIDNSTFEPSIKQILTIPKPDIIFKNSRFVVTGTCAELNPTTKTNYTRTNLESTIKYLEGTTTKNTSSLTDYLVVCGFSSKHWAHSNYGRKIEKAMQYDDLKIVTDIDLLEAIKNIADGS